MQTQDLKTSRPQDLKSSSPQVLKSSRPQVLKPHSCRALKGGGGQVSQAHGDAARQLPGATVMFIENRAVVDAMSEHSNASHFVAGVVAHRGAHAEQALQRVGFDRRRSEAHYRRFRLL